MLHVREKTFARLLAVVADVDAGFELLGYHCAGRIESDSLQPHGVDLLASAQLAEHFGEFFGARQAPGVGGQNFGIGSLHEASLSYQAAFVDSSALDM